MGHIPVANQADVATGQVNFVIPICGVQEGASVLLNTRNRRPLPVVENAACVDENIAMIVHNSATRKILHTHIVATPRVVPDSAVYLVLGLDVLV